LIAAALTALPLIAQAGQGLISAVSQDVTSFLGAGPTSGAGQNVPDSAASGSAASTEGASAAPSPITLSSVAQTLSSHVLGALNAAQGDLSGVASFASGQSGVSKSQLESAAQSVGGLLGQSPAASTSAADQLFNAIDPSGGGQITSSQLGAYLGQLQSQATAKYQAADSLVNGFAGQMSGLLGGASTLA